MMQATLTPRNAKAPPPLKINLADIPAGAAGTRATLRLMARAAVAGAKSEPVYSLARRLVQALPPRDVRAEVNAIFLYVRDRVRYTRDVLHVESLQSPGDTLKLRTGDCDDKATLAAALLLSIGIPARFVAMGNSPGVFSHVYAQAKVADQWITLETCLPWPLGKTAPGRYTMVQPVEEGAMALGNLGLVSSGRTTVKRFTGGGGITPVYRPTAASTSTTTKTTKVGSARAQNARAAITIEAQHPKETAALAAYNGLSKKLVSLNKKQWIAVFKNLDHYDKKYYLALANRWINFQKSHGGTLNFGNDVLPHAKEFLLNGKAAIPSYTGAVNIANVLPINTAAQALLKAFQNGGKGVSANQAYWTGPRLASTFPSKSLFVAVRDLAEAAGIAIGIAYAAGAVVGSQAGAAGGAASTTGGTVAAGGATVAGSGAAAAGETTAAATGASAAGTAATAAGGIGTAAKLASGASGAASAGSAIGDVVKTVTGGGSLADTLKNLTQLASQYKLGQAQLDLLKQQASQQGATAPGQATGATGASSLTATTKPLPGWLKAAMVGGGLLLGKVLLLS